MCLTGDSNQRSHNAITMNADTEYIESKTQVSRAYCLIWMFASTYFFYSLLLIPRMWTYGCLRFLAMNKFSMDSVSGFTLIAHWFESLFYTPNISLKVICEEKNMCWNSDTWSPLPVSQYLTYLFGIYVSLHLLILSPSGPIGCTWLYLIIVTTLIPVDPSALILL